MPLVRIEGFSAQKSPTTLASQAPVDKKLSRAWRFMKCKDIIPLLRGLVAAPQLLPCPGTAAEA